jgi:hypothetical protein
MTGSKRSTCTMRSVGVVVVPVGLLALLEVASAYYRSWLEFALASLLVLWSTARRVAPGIANAAVYGIAGLLALRGVAAAFRWPCAVSVVVDCTVLVVYWGCLLWQKRSTTGDAGGRS